MVDNIKGINNQTIAEIRNLIVKHPINDQNIKNQENIGLIAREIKKIKKLRKNKIEALKMAIQRGEYDIDTEKVAEAIINEIRQV